MSRRLGLQRLEAAFANIHMHPLNAVVSNGGELILRIRAMTLIGKPLQFPDRRYFVAMGPARFRPQHHHHSLPLAPMRPNARPEFLKRHQMCQLMRHRLRHKLIRITLGQFPVETDQVPPPICLPCCLSRQIPCHFRPHHHPKPLLYHRAQGIQLPLHAMFNFRIHSRARKSNPAQSVNNSPCI